MRRTLNIEASAKSAFDEETNEFFSALTPEQQAEGLREISDATEKWFRANSDDDAEISVNVYVEEVEE
ncbi:hypothetical protein D3C74_465600 [compost metagenome]